VLLINGWFGGRDKLKVSLDGIAWAKQDFFVGSGTTSTFILPPDHTLHWPKKDILGTLRTPSVMLGVSKARTWRQLLIELWREAQGRHLALPATGCA
jgi:hypothetical protein